MEGVATKVIGIMISNQIGSSMFYIVNRMILTLES
jgi:hypothetical protein